MRENMIGTKRTKWVMALTGLCVVAFQNCGNMNALNPNSKSLSQSSRFQLFSDFGQFAGFTNPNSWTIGPVIYGRNYSVGMPLHPSSHPEGWSFDITQAPSSVHYVTAACGSLTGKSELVLKYRVEADPGVVLYPTNFPGSPSILSLYFQRAGDNWSAAGAFESFRWYSPLYHTPIRLGDYELAVPLDANWTAILTSSAESNPTAFEAAKANCGQVGFVFGGGDGRGHGVSATGPAKFIVKSFEIRDAGAPALTPTPQQDQRNWMPPSAPTQGPSDVNPWLANLCSRFGFVFCN